MEVCHHFALTAVVLGSQNRNKSDWRVVMPIGTVKWFNDAKGFGFIEPEGGGEDVFAHFSAIVMDGFRTLKQGAKVQYELTNGPKGLLAINIQPVSAEAAAQSAANSHEENLHFLSAETPSGQRPIH
jgi:cold shock protein